jgi:uncharacterized integral membrane protein
MAEQRETRDVVRMVAVGVLVVVLLALIIDNTRKVKIGYVFGDARLPLVVLVLLSAALGALVSWLLTRRHSRN